MVVVRVSHAIYMRFEYNYNGKSGCPIPGTANDYTYFFFYHCIYFFLSKVRVYVDIKGVHMCFVENWHSPLSAKTRTICNTNRIVCRKEKIIRVTEATFGRFGKRKKRKKKRSCGTKNNVLSKVKEICDKNTSCLLDTSSPVFIKPCPGSSVCLRVTWKCQKKKGE